jgi:hypothetical protein
MDPLVISYRFDTESGTHAEFDLELDPDTLALEEAEGDLPEWTALEFNKCPNCPLDSDEYDQCPSAAHLPRLIQSFNHLVSHDKVRVEVVTAERTFLQTVSMQKGIGALMGLIMATSGCPITAFFRPMARFHLPFSTQDETIYRASSAYLLADYFRTRASGDFPDWDLEGLTAVYVRVHTLNKAFFERVKVAARTDSSLNALVHLDMFALMLPLQAKREFPAIMKYFKPYLDHFPDW